MKSSEVLVLGGGIIGLSLALELRRRKLEVLLIERGEPGHEASHAAAGMLSAFDPQHHPLLEELAVHSWNLYSDFLEQVCAESGVPVPVHDEPSILVGVSGLRFGGHLRSIDREAALSLQPGLRVANALLALLEERYLDPRDLLKALVAAAREKKVEIASGTEVTDIAAEGPGFVVTSKHARHRARSVVNCCGAWAGSFGPVPFPTRPRKGQMLAVAPARRGLLKRTVRDDNVYLVPRDDGRVVIGATVEDVGFDKRVDPAAIQTLHSAAIDLVPDLENARILEAWAGLRPGTPDDLPILGATEVPNYYVSTGHFRNGILLAAASAQILADAITGCQPQIDISPFSPARFEGAALRSGNFVVGAERSR